MVAPLRFACPERARRDDGIEALVLVRLELSLLERTSRRRLLLYRLFRAERIDSERVQALG